MTRPVIRWIPAIAIPAVVIAAAIIMPITADASPRLPEKSAQQVLEMIVASTDAQFAGTVEQSSKLGLPDIPNVGPRPSGSAATSALELLTGSHTARVFVGAEHSVRVQLMDKLAERDAIRSGNEAWTYDSKANATTHLVITPEAQAAMEDAAKADAASHQAEAGSAAIPDASATPADLAQKLLDAVDPSTAVAVGDTARVAGRPVYTITITPKAADTLVASATLSVDSETGLPLAATVMAVGQDEPAVSIAFSSIDFGDQDASLFAFAAPEGSTLTEKTLTAADVKKATDNTPTGSEAAATERPTVIGSGWSTVVSIPAALVGMAGGDSSLSGTAFSSMTPDNMKLDEYMSMDMDQASLEKAAAEQEAALRILDQVTTPVAGGRVLQTSLFSVFFADDGRVLAGAVSPDALVAAAAR